MTAVILDASALIALLKNEVGAKPVADVLTSASISAVNFAEVVGHFAKLGMPADAIEAMLAPLPIRVVSADQSHAEAAGLLQASTAPFGLSIADRFCLALARQEALPAWTADRAWLKVADIVDVNVVLIR